MVGAISSVGRALRLHRRCREFESLIAHQILNFLTGQHLFHWYKKFSYFFVMFRKRVNKFNREHIIRGKLGVRN